MDGRQRLGEHRKVTKHVDRLWRLVQAGDPDTRCRAAEELLTMFGVSVAERDRRCDLLGGLKSRDSERVGLATSALESLIRHLQDCRQQ